MKAFYEATARLRIEIDAPGIKELFADLATVQEIFGSDPRCEVCDSEARCQHRIVDDNHYYELVCTNQQCRARLSFGQHKKGGGLFPKRKDEDGNWIPNRGWAKWEASRTAAESRQVFAIVGPSTSLIDACSDLGLADWLKQWGRS